MNRACRHCEARSAAAVHQAMDEAAAAWMATGLRALAMTAEADGARQSPARRHRHMDRRVAARLAMTGWCMAGPSPASQIFISRPMRQDT